jgi:ABC-type phosphate transport system substrate-binding protein
MKRTMNLMVGSVLVLGAGPALAQNPNYIDTTKQDATTLIGSDTLNKVMDDLILALNSAGQLQGGITIYQGLGSSQGERQLAGSPNAGEPTCLPPDPNGLPELNPGCQEISPMSRELQSGICDDDPNHPLTINDQAEGLAFCADGLVVIANNDSIGAFGTDAGTCAAYFALPNTDNAVNQFPDRGVGALRRSGNLAPSGYAVADWRDVLRLVYTGCRSVSLDGTCAATDRVTRCSRPERQDVINNWANLFEGVACAQSTGCPTGLRHAYRRDDASGTTGVFLTLLGVAASVGTNINSRASVFATIPTTAITAIPANLSFCDGGQPEGVLPTGIGAVSAQFPSGEPLYTGGDPIRTTCAAEDDICGPDGKIGVVRPIRSTDTFPNAYPTHQCQRRFELVQFMNTSLPVCPDRTKPSAGRCRLPFFENAGFKTFNCLTSQRQSAPTAVAGTDGRSYNYVIREPNGTVLFQDGATRRMPITAMFRQNTALLNNSPTFTAGKEFVTADYVCRESDATRNIGCFTANSKCVIGYAGREAAYNNAQAAHLTNEPAKLNSFSPSNANIGAASYPFSRLLWLNASRGFENIVTDCRDRGGSEAYCKDQRRIAKEFYEVGQPGNLIANICNNAGFIPLDGPVCKGGQATTATATAPACGAPAVQVASACEPEAVADPIQPNRDN